MTPPSTSSSFSSHLPGSYPATTSFSKEQLDSTTSCNDQLLHLRITSELNRDRSAGPRKRLRQRRVLVGCLCLVVQIWSALLAGRYLVGFCQDPSPLSFSSSIPPTKILALIAFSSSTLVTVTTFFFILLLRYVSPRARFFLSSRLHSSS
ncbi:hypothetical protein BDY24DRAFT_188563 [Mrakia frigida]|uniref:uncharacterized protein n=1 Tax=Mrakia frigida TaxID=29902 RepID=UPI003FCC0DE2